MPELLVERPAATLEARAARTPTRVPGALL
jgi:hypothetical protein